MEKSQPQFYKKDYKPSWNIPIAKDKIIAFLELVLNNCVLSFQHKFYKQLLAAAVGSPVSPVIENIYM